MNICEDKAKGDQKEREKEDSNQSSNKSEDESENYPLFQLFNKRIESEEIKKFLAEECNNKYERKEIKEYIYISAPSMGWSTCFRNGILEAIYLYNSVKPYEQYKKKLPYKLNFDLVNSDVVQYFGDTKSKGGGNYPIWLSYDHLGIEINFLGMDWNDRKNPITFFCIYDKKSKEGKEFNCNFNV